MFKGYILPKKYSKKFIFADLFNICVYFKCDYCAKLLKKAKKQQIFKNFKYLL